MQALNVEIKARCTNPDKIRTVLIGKNADFKGTDHQIDTYYKVPQGRLKLRQGTIENALIHYQRSDQQGPKTSEIKLFKTTAETSLPEVLNQALEALVVVDKQREIYFIDNVKFHIDQVQRLGSFVEIEAIDEHGVRTAAELEQQCQHYLELFSIAKEDLLAHSYSDMIIELNP